MFSSTFERIAPSKGLYITKTFSSSWIGYTAYIWLLGHVPTSKVSTYAYVNPLVAVFLGWAIEHEVVNQFILAGSAIVIASVILVTSAKVKERAEVEELVETVGD